LQYASAGVGSSSISARVVQARSGVDILHVPFKGGGPAMIDVVGGHTKVMFSSLVQTTPHTRPASSARSASAPRSEQGAARRAVGCRSRRTHLRGGQLVGIVAPRNAAADHRQGPCGADRGAGFAEVEKQFAAKARGLKKRLRSSVPSWSAK